MFSKALGKDGCLLMKSSYSNGCGQDKRFSDLVKSDWFEVLAWFKHKLQLCKIPQCAAEKNCPSFGQKWCQCSDVFVGLHLQPILEEFIEKRVLDHHKAILSSLWKTSFCQHQCPNTGYPIARYFLQFAACGSEIHWFTDTWVFWRQGPYCSWSLLTLRHFR